MAKDIRGWEFELLNEKLFWRKMLLIVVSMAVLVPLVLMKTRVPATVYVGTLLVIHVWVLLLYVYKVQWRRFSRSGLALRIGSVVIFSYLLSKVTFSGGPEVLVSIALAFTLHVVILLALMLRIERRTA